jgi:DNA-binding NtrC family response regulator
MRSQTQSIDLYALTDLLKVENCVLQILKTVQQSSTLPAVKSESYRFSKDIIRIGAGDKCDLIIEDSTVSRIHCEIRKMPQGYLLVDQDSRNGTYVGQLRVKEAYLYVGCEFKIGSTILKFSVEVDSIPIQKTAKEQYGPLTGSSPEMQLLYSLIDKVAPSDLSVVIQGETGTGKELVAQAIHQSSKRSSSEMIVFDCSAIPEHLIESELFGHEKGSFSGAIRTHKGVFEQADGGTLFLDELGEMPLNLQPKLLRALESGMIRRIGSEKTIKVNVRVISATNRDLTSMVEHSLFRQDLFYRLAKVQIKLPGLAQRVSDIPLIAKAILQKLNQHYQGFKSISGFEPEALALLQTWLWPGNVRELRNVIERAYTFSQSSLIGIQDLSHLLQTGSSETQSTLATVPFLPNLPEGGSLKEAKEMMISEFEREYLIQLIEKHQQNISQVAREAGIDRRHVYRLIQKYQIALNER